MPQSIPNYLTTSPDGTVTAEFSGGIRIPMDPNELPGAPRKAVSWVDSTNGGLIAQIAGAYVGGVRRAIINAGDDDAQLILRNPDIGGAAASDATLVGGSVAAYSSSSSQQVRIVESSGGTQLLYAPNMYAVSMLGSATYSATFAVNQTFSVVSGFYSMSGWSSGTGVGNYHAYLISDPSNATITELGSGANWYVNVPGQHTTFPTHVFKQSVGVINGGAFKLNAWSPGLTRDSYDYVNALLFFHR